MTSGWIKLHRAIWENWIWDNSEPFDMRSAWIDLLLMANHADKKIMSNGEFIVVERGQIMTSVRKLSDKWHWSVNKVYRFLRLLERDGMVQKNSNKYRTLLTIENYSIYQDLENTNENTNKHINRTPTETPSRQYRDTNGNTIETPTETEQERKNNKNVKNDKNDKNIKKKEDTLRVSKKEKSPKHCYGEHNHVQLTDSELERLNTEYGAEFILRVIEFFDNYIEEKGYKAKSHNMAIRRWVINAVREKDIKDAELQRREQREKNAQSIGEVNLLEKWGIGL